MQKIMFNDKCCLTEAVLSGRKTQTRRFITYPGRCNGKDVAGYAVSQNAEGRQISWLVDEEGFQIEGTRLMPTFRIGEEVAIAQSYRDVLADKSLSPLTRDKILRALQKSEAGLNNKMFVLANLMPHTIRITGFRLERLSRISNEDCMAEGIEREGDMYGFNCINSHQTSRCLFLSPYLAYVNLIDTLHGEGTFDSTQFVWVYDFKLIK